MKEKNTELTNKINENLNTLNAISPLDGRYGSRNKIKNLRSFCSEFALIFHRLKVEITWLISLSEIGLPEFPSFSNIAKKRLWKLIEDFSDSDANCIRAIEHRINHDVKAVEYWIKEKLSHDLELKGVLEFVHFACTSDDINNTSYALMLSGTRRICLIPCLMELTNKLGKFAIQYAEQPMLSRTHGQPASPTTLGKEFANFAARLKKGIDSVAVISPLAKLNGATGNYNAHVSAYPEVNWPKFCKKVLENLGLTQNEYTTQIEPHDWISELFDAIARVNNILLHLNRDIWSYFSIGYFFTSGLENSVIGSSTMPHKINPIDFENSEGNIGLANSILHHMSEKLPISRWQRDLTDSTVLRNIGVALGHCLLAWDSCLRGLSKIRVNKAVIDTDIDQHWEILAEPIQTVMRRYGFCNPYEQLKNLTRGKQVTKESIQGFISKLNLPIQVKERLLGMTPRSYLGLSIQLAKSITT